MQIAVFEGQAFEEQMNPAVQQIVTADPRNFQILQLTSILKQSDERARNDKPRNSHVSGVAELSRPFRRTVYTEQPYETFLLRKQNYTIIVNIGPVPSVMGELSVILDTGAGPNFLCQHQLRPFFENASRARA